jgi:uncharacterized surface protein with fasciclin (FAS1) repeats
MKKINILNYLFIFGWLLLTSCDGVKDSTIIPNTTFQRINSDPELSTFSKAIQIANIEKELPNSLITIFAPTNDAFVEAGINVDATDAAVLKNIVLYHIIGRRIDSSNFDGKFNFFDNLNGNSYTSLNFTQTNSFLFLTIRNAPVPDYYLTNQNKFSVNGADITKLDALESSNGNVHKINKVLIPPSGILPDVIKKEQNIGLFNRAIRRAKASLVAPLSFADDASIAVPYNVGGIITPHPAGLGYIIAPSDALRFRTNALGNQYRNADFSLNSYSTVFAPTDDAMIAAGYTEAAIDAASPTTLYGIVRQHILRGRYYSSDFLEGTNATPLGTFGLNSPFAGSTLTVNVSSALNSVTVTKFGGTTGKVIKANINASNGVLHIIDKVLL